MNISTNSSSAERLGSTRLMATSFSNPAAPSARAFHTSAIPPDPILRIRLYRPSLSKRGGFYVDRSRNGSMRAGRMQLRGVVRRAQLRFLRQAVSRQGSPTGDRGGAQVRADVRLFSGTGVALRRDQLEPRS